MSTAEIIVGIWQGLLALVGAGVAVAQIREIKRGGVLQRERVAAWRATPQQILLFLIVAAFCLASVSVICSALGRAFFPEALSSNNGLLFLVPVTQTVSLICVLLAVKFLPAAFPQHLDAASASEREPLFQSVFSLKPFGVPAFFALGFFVSTVAALSVTGIISFFPEHIREIFRENQILVDALAGSDNLLATLLCVPAITIFTPIIEEIIFRAGLYRFLKSRLNAVPAAVLSSVIFAILHDAPISYLPLTLLGCIFCFAYEKTGRIAVPICIHALFNANTLLCLFVI